MGALYHSVCYESPSVARDYLMSDCARVDATSAGAGQGWTCLPTEAPANGVVIWRYGTVSGTAAGGAIYAPSFPACTVQQTNPFMLSAEDGAVVAAFIVVVWGAAWAWRAAKKALDVADE